jgi:hypothetical protein
MALRHRLKKLDGGGGPLECPGCAAWLGPVEEIEIVVSWSDIDGTAEDTKEPTTCSLCGSPDFIVVTWQDLEDATENEELYGN